MNEDRRAIEQDYLFQQLSTAETERAFRLVDHLSQVFAKDIMGVIPNPVAWLLFEKVCAFGGGLIVNSEWLIDIGEWVASFTIIN